VRRVRPRLRSGHPLALEEVGRYGDPALLFYNVNTAEELAEAEAMWQRRG